jgi:sterol 14alpha-demethylase
MMTKTPPVVSGGLPVLGHALQMMNKRDQLFKRGHKEHGDIFTINLGPIKTVVLGDKAYNRMFYTQTDKQLNVSEAYPALKAAVGETLFLAGKDKYINQRALLQVIFKRERMVRYIEAMNVEIQRWIDGLGAQGRTNISSELLRLTQYVAAHAFLGPNFRSELNEDFWKAYADIGKSLDVVLPTNLPLPKFKRRDRAKALIRATFAVMIEKRRQNPDKYDDLITLLLSTPQKDGTIMPDDEIATLFTGLLFAGHETTAGQAGWAVIQLLQHPDYLQLVQNEIKEHVPYGRAIDASVLPQLKHVYWGIDETTRLRPSADLQMRVVETETEIGDYTIPQGWQVLVASDISHYDNDTYTNPEQYDPLRYSPERNEGSDPFAIVSFGGGMHKCTGMNFAQNEMAIIITRLLRSSSRVCCSSSM